MTTKADTYNYNQNPLGGGNYLTITGAGLKSTTSGAKASSGSVQDNVSAWAPTNYAFANDQMAIISFTNLGSYDWVGVGVRLAITGGGCGYLMYAEAESSSISVYALTGGTVGTPGNYLVNWAGLTFANGDTMELDVMGTTLTGKHNGTTLGTVTDSTYASGQPGLAYEDGNNNVSLITAFSATDSTAGLAATPPAGALVAGGNAPTVVRPTSTVITPSVALLAPQRRVLRPVTRKIFLPSRQAA